MPLNDIELLVDIDMTENWESDKSYKEDKKGNFESRYFPMINVGIDSW